MECLGSNGVSGKHDTPRGSLGKLWLGLGFAISSSVRGQKVQNAGHYLLLTVLAMGLTSPANAQSGAALAERIERGDSKAGAAVKALSAKEKAAFVAWAVARRKAKKRWTHLAPALAVIGTRGAVAELAKVGCKVRGKGGPSAAALKALRGCKPSLAVPQLLTGTLSARGRAKGTLVAELSRLIGASPGNALNALDMAIGAGALGLESQSGSESVASAVSKALAEAKDVSQFTGITSSSPAALALGLAWGAAARASELVIVDEEGNGYDARLSGLEECEALLSQVREHEDARVTLAICQALPSLAFRDDPDWSDEIYEASLYPVSSRAAAEPR